MSFKKIGTQVWWLSTILALTVFLVGSVASAKPASKPELPFVKQLQDELDKGIKKIKGKGISVAIIVHRHKTCFRGLKLKAIIKVNKLTTSPRPGKLLFPFVGSKIIFPFYWFFLDLRCRKEL